MAVRYEIGPAGQPPTTVYYYDNGIVTLSPRSLTQRSPLQVASIVSAIQVFVRGVLVNDPAAPLGTIDDPFDFRMQLDGPALAFHFRCAASDGSPPHLVAEATHDLVTRVTTFEARPERAVQWGTFLLFVRWMDLIRSMAVR